MILLRILRAKGVFGKAKEGFNTEDEGRATVCHGAFECASRAQRIIAISVAPRGPPFVLRGKNPACLLPLHIPLP